MSAITTATIVGISAAAASAGTGIYAAKKGASAARDAAATQSAAADKALALQKEQYGQARQDFSPYQQQGAAALGRLGTMATAPRQTFNPGQPQMLGMPPPQAQGAPGGLGTPWMAQSGGPPPMTPQGPGGGLWTVQGPDGSTKQLPPNIAQQFISRGARRIA